MTSPEEKGRFHSGEVMFSEVRGVRSGQCVEGRRAEMGDTRFTV